MPNPTERFWAKVDLHGPVPEYDPTLGPCWLWTAAVGTHGYGAFRDASGVTTTAHRWAYEHYSETVPAGWQVDHLCRVPLCVKPTHLEAVTRRENVRRGAQGEMVVECKNGHPYDEANTYRRPNGQRDCRACKRERERRRISVQQVEKYVGKRGRKAS